MLVSKTINSKEYRILMIGLDQSGYTPEPGIESSSVKCGYSKVVLTRKEEEIKRRKIYHSGFLLPS